ncbi:MAG: hypothetical protein R3D53_13400 [Paracoccaceae bacterium]
MLAGDPAEKPPAKPKDKPARRCDAILALRAEARKCRRVSKLSEMIEKLDAILADATLYEPGKAAEAKWMKKHAEARDGLARAGRFGWKALEALERPPRPGKAG